MCEVLDAIEKRGFERGFDQGIEQGYEEGAVSCARKIAFRMHRRGADAEEIADIVGETPEMILSWLLGPEG